MEGYKYSWSWMNPKDRSSTAKVYKCFTKLLEQQMFTATSWFVFKGFIKKCIMDKQTEIVLRHAHFPIYFKGQRQVTFWAVSHAVDECLKPVHYVHLQWCLKVWASFRHSFISTYNTFKPKCNIFMQVQFKYTVLQIILGTLSLVISSGQNVQFLQQNQGQLI